MGTSIDANRLARRKLDLNSATAEELQAIEGVDEELARRIVEHRQQEGGFKDLDDLLRVTGKKAAEALRRSLTIGPS